MRLARWLRFLRFGRRERPRVVVTFDDRGTTCQWPDGTRMSVTWNDLQAIEIRTTDQGPFVEDVFLLLHTNEGGLAVPQEADGSAALLAHLQQWPGFDTEAVIAAMTCTDNAAFPCWRRDADEQQSQRFLQE